MSHSILFDFCSKIINSVLILSTEFYGRFGLMEKNKLTA